MAEVCYSNHISKYRRCWAHTVKQHEWHGQSQRSWTESVGCGNLLRFCTNFSCCFTRSASANWHSLLPYCIQLAPYICCSFHIICQLTISAVIHPALIAVLFSSLPQHLFHIQCRPLYCPLYVDSITPKYARKLSLLYVMVACYSSPLSPNALELPSA